MLATEEVLASHEAALGEQNPDNVSTCYAKDAVGVVNGALSRGRQEITHRDATLISDLPHAQWRSDVTMIHQRLGVCGMGM